MCIYIYFLYAMYTPSAIYIHLSIVLTSQGGHCHIQRFVLQLRKIGLKMKNHEVHETRSIPEVPGQGRKGKQI